MVLTSEMVEFLEHGTRTGMVGWVASDGRPLVAPVWFVVETGELVFVTGRGTSKARALARDPRLVLTVDLPAPPYAFVQVQGLARTSDEPDEVRRAATAVGRRYTTGGGPDQPAADDTAPDLLAVRLRPTKVNAELNVTG